MIETTRGPAMIDGCDHLHTELGPRRLVPCGRPVVLEWSARQTCSGEIMTTRWGACSAGHASYVLRFLGSLPGMSVPSLARVMANSARIARRRATIPVIAQRLPRPRLEAAS